MPGTGTLRDRVVDLEERVDGHDQQLQDLQAWIEEEKTLSDIHDQRIKLLEQADDIYARRLAALMPALGKPKRQRRKK